MLRPVRQHNNRVERLGVGLTLYTGKAQLPIAALALAGGASRGT